MKLQFDPRVSSKTTTLTEMRFFAGRVFLKSVLDLRAVDRVECGHSFLQTISTID